MLTGIETSLLKPGSTPLRKPLRIVVVGGDPQTFEVWWDGELIGRGEWGGKDGFGHALDELLQQPEADPHWPVDTVVDKIGEALRPSD